jgi:hypothetical protein
MILGGLVYIGIKAVALMKAARHVGIKNMADVQEVIGRVQRLEPRFRELEKNQAALAASMERLQQQTELMSYLAKELDKATGNLSTLKSS